MSLRSFRFYLSGYHHYYGHIRLPRQQRTTISLGSPTFMRYLLCARNIMLLRVSTNVCFAIASIGIAGFSILGRLTDTLMVHEALLMQLTLTYRLSFTKLVSLQCVRLTST